MRGAGMSEGREGRVLSSGSGSVAVFGCESDSQSWRGPFRACVRRSSMNPSIRPVLGPAQMTNQPNNPRTSRHRLLPVAPARIDLLDQSGQLREAFLDRSLPRLAIVDFEAIHRAHNHDI